MSEERGRALAKMKIQVGVLVGCLVAVVVVGGIYASAQTRSHPLPIILYIRGNQWDFGDGSSDEKPACSTAHGLKVQQAQPDRLLGYLGDVTTRSDALVAHVQSVRGGQPVYGAAGYGGANGSRQWGILMVKTASGCYVVYQNAP